MSGARLPHNSPGLGLVGCGRGCRHGRHCKRGSGFGWARRAAALYAAHEAAGQDGACSLMDEAASLANEAAVLAATMPALTFGGVAAKLAVAWHGLLRQQQLQFVAPSAAQWSVFAAVGSAQADLALLADRPFPLPPMPAEWEKPITDEAAW